MLYFQLNYCFFPLMKDAYSIQSVTSDSPVVENTSSFDSSTSSPSMAHLPPIRVRVDESNDGNTRLQEEIKGGRALEEQFSGQLRLIPPLSANFAHSYAAVANTTINGNDSNNNCVMPDEACSEHGLLGASRKPPLPLSLQQRISGGISLPSPNDSKHAAGFNLPSPDSVKRYLFCAVYFLFFFLPPYAMYTNLFKVFDLVHETNKILMLFRNS